MTPAFKTTEFWFSLASAVVGALLASGVFGDGSTAQRVLGIAATVLGAVTHTVSRTYLKASTGNAQPVTDEKPASVNKPVDKPA